MSILVIAEHDNVSLKGATLNTVAAAKAIGGDIHVLVAGANCGAAASAAAKVAGVAKVLVADNAAYAHQLAENVSLLVAEIGKQYTHILAPATSSGKNIAPRAAALLDVAQISEISAVVSPDTFVRPIYAGNALATVQSKDKIKVISVRSTGFDAVPASGGSAATKSAGAWPFSETASTRVQGREGSPSQAVTKASATAARPSGKGHVPPSCRHSCCNAAQRARKA